MKEYQHATIISVCARVLNHYNPVFISSCIQNAGPVKFHSLVFSVSSFTIQSLLEANLQSFSWSQYWHYQWDVRMVWSISVALLYRLDMLAPAAEYLSVREPPSPNHTHNSDKMLLLFSPVLTFMGQNRLHFNEQYSCPKHSLDPV